MPSSEAHVATVRSSRYLVQLCRHAGQPRGHPGAGGHGEGAAPGGVRHTDWSDHDGVIDFGRGRCTVQATPEELVLRAEADDADGLLRIQQGIAHRLETIGRRDGLTVRWHPPTASP